MTEALLKMSPGRDIQVRRAGVKRVNFRQMLFRRHWLTRVV
jgi:hypothetical protein